MTTWIKELKIVITELNEDINTLVTTMTDEELNTEFDSGFGGENGISFTAWTKNYVYFPICYDGSEWVGYAPRNPRNIKMAHQGG